MPYTLADIKKLVLRVDAETFTQRDLRLFLAKMREVRRTWPDADYSARVTLTDAETHGCMVVAAARAGWLISPDPNTLTPENVDASAPTLIKAWGETLSRLFVEATTVDPKASSASFDMPTSNGASDPETLMASGS